MDNLDERIDDRVNVYKQKLIEEYRMDHPECRDMSDEDILMLNPFSDDDLLFIYVQELSKLREELKEHEKRTIGVFTQIEYVDRDIKEAQEKINSVDYMRAMDIKDDIHDYNVRKKSLEELKQEYLNIMYSMDDMIKELKQRIDEKNEEQPHSGR